MHGLWGPTTTLKNQKKEIGAAPGPRRCLVQSPPAPLLYFAESKGELFGKDGGVLSKSLDGYQSLAFL